MIRVPGYTPEEKVEISRSYLIPRQLDDSGLPQDRIRWSDAAVRAMITDYTFEAGVRDLERKVGAICRKAARRAAEGDTRMLRVDRRSLDKYLGPPRHASESVSETSEIGVSNGLAWTEAGGDVLRIEAAVTRGRGIVLTGQLGEVMKESGQAALTWVRSKLDEFGLDETLFSRREVHVHVPAGAIPKDGPSAGVTMATALASLATGIPVRSDVAMTGEVTLRGNVLAVGGVRDKALAALRAGVRTVLIPEKNLVDLREVPRELARRIEFIGVSHMDEVLTHALERPPTGRRRRVQRAPGRTTRAAATAKSRS